MFVFSDDMSSRSLIMCAIGWIYSFGIAISPVLGWNRYFRLNYLFSFLVNYKPAPISGAVGGDSKVN
jgi:hypothetical protein